MENTRGKKKNSARKTTVLNNASIPGNIIEKITISNDRRNKSWMIAEEFRSLRNDQNIIIQDESGNRISFSAIDKNNLSTQALLKQAEQEISEGYIPQIYYSQSESIQHLPLPPHSTQVRQIVQDQPTFQPNTGQQTAPQNSFANYAQRAISGRPQTPPGSGQSKGSGWNPGKQ